ncbi:MAG: HDIG domain-containing metalloprotein, partial [Desulfatiglandales bacterium]
MERDEALRLLGEFVKNPNLIKHSLASERVMIRLAERLGEDPKTWGLAGLLHDIDVELVGQDLNR